MRNSSNQTFGVLFSPHSTEADAGNADGTNVTTGHMS